MIIVWNPPGGGAGGTVSVVTTPTPPIAITNIGSQYTYKRLQDETLSWLDETGTSGVTLTNVKSALQQAHMGRLAQRNWNFMLWQKPITFNTTSGVQTYSLHSEYYKPFYFFNQTTKAYLIEMNARQLGPSGVRWNTDTGGANRFTLWGRTCVAAQPTVAGVITIRSDNAGDTSQTVTIQGTDSTNAYKINETLQANGTVVATGTQLFNNPIMNITLSAPFAGTLTVACGALTILVLQPGELGRSYPQMYLLNNPTTASAIEYRFYRQPTVLINDNDIPDIPPPFTQILVWDALISLAAYNTDVDQKNVSIWALRQKDLEESMIAADDSGNSLESEPRYVRSTDGDESTFVPRIFG